MSSDRRRPWIEIDDPHISPAELVEGVEARLEKRRQEMGPVNRRFPSFDPSRPFSASTSKDESMARLRYYLQHLEKREPADTTPALAPSPATRLPVLGRLWQLVRREAHHLVLFYVNRSLAHQTRINKEMILALREMAALLEEKDEEIRRLRARLDEVYEEEE